MGGFFGGVLTGAVVVVVVGVVLSLNAPLGSRPELVTTAPEAKGVAPQAVETDLSEPGPDADLVELAPRGLNALDDATGKAEAPIGIAAEPDARPDIIRQIGQVEKPATGAAATVEIARVAPATPPAPLTAPVTQDQGAEPVSVDPTPPAAPRPPEATALAEPQPTPGADSDQAAASPDAEGDAAEPDADLPEQQAAVTEPQAAAPNPIAVEGEENTQPRKRARIAALPQIGGQQIASASPTIGRRVVPLTERDDPAEDVVQVAEKAPADPIDAYAAPFENPEGKPLMSIILIDDAGAFGAEALQDFPYPLTFAVSPSDPEAADKMKRYREAGFEVLAIADLPAAASAQDAEISLSVWLDTLPETVGILEGVQTGVQGNRKLADQVAAIAGGTGRGLVLQDNGLNTAFKLAARNGIPSSVVFRDIDGARQDPDVMRRFLDQAAFRAGQEGAVVMLGRLRPETISALLLWGLEDRSSRVALAPISAVMKSQIQ